MKYLIFSVIVILAVGTAGFLSSDDGDVDMQADQADNNNLVATIYKSPTCGCCGVYASYMKKEGYDVRVEDVQDMATIKQELGVPNELESCHTMEMAGYVVEGHIPNEAIQKLLAEKPNIKGIGMAGMPSGSPGMPGPRHESFVVYQINHDGAKGEIFMTI